MKLALLLLVTIVAVPVTGCLTRRVQAPPSPAILEARAAVKVAGSARADGCNTHSFSTSAPVEVAFPYNSADLEPAAGEHVARAGQWLRCRPALLVRIIGAPDSQGAPEAQRRLAAARATALRQALLQAGVAADRVVDAAPAEAEVLTLTARGRGW